jgi:hypothetical protein
LVKFLEKNLSNFLGWTTKRKIVVIESDDWGSIRMPSLGAYERLRQKGLPMEAGDSARYNTLDTLASSNDLEALFETLTSFRDKVGNHPIITAMSLVANPDFEKIKSADYSAYYYEPFTQTLDRYGMGNCFTFWQHGIAEKLFLPQFHGREHLNIAAWMRALQRKDKFTLMAFEEGMWGFRSQDSSSVNFQAAFDLEHKMDIAVQGEVIRSGLALFRELHKYDATFFVPPNGPINNKLLKDAAEGGIRFVSVPKLQREPLGGGKTKNHFHYIGKRSNYGQRFITRNCFFEPSKKGQDWVSACMANINIAFRWNKPAIISSHRVNYVGSLQPSNRKNGNDQLALLLKKMTDKWPDIEFMSSDELGRLIDGSN